MCMGHPQVCGKLINIFLKLFTKFLNFNTKKFIVKVYHILDCFARFGNLVKEVR